MFQCYLRLVHGGENSSRVLADVHLVHQSSAPFLQGRDVSLCQEVLDHRVAIFFELKGKTLT